MRFCAVIGIFLLFGTGTLLAQGTWTPFVKNINGSGPNGAAFLNDSYGFVSTANGTFRTTDGGKTWVHTNMPGSLARTQCYFYTPSNIFYNGELESVDSGMTWTTLLQPADGALYIERGIFFDAGGRVSLNHARTWRLLDSNFKNGESLVGNLDGGIAMWGGSGMGNDTSLYTTDLGKSWHLGENGVESDYGYAIPYTHTYFRCGGDGEDGIQRSIDGGATWQTVFGLISEEYLSDGFAGNSCIVYAQTMDTVKYNYPSGILRSTDQGDTWIPIGGPIGRDDYNICGVTSRGAVCYAMNFHPGYPLWKYIDSSLLRPILSDMKITHSFPDTIFMSDCDSAKIKLNVDFSACDFIHFRDFKIDSLPAKNYRIAFTPGHVLRTGHPDSLGVSFMPSIAGTYNVGLHFSFSASDWSGTDTVIPLVLVIKANPAVLNINKTDTINFGTQSFCNAGGKDTILLSNLSCHALKVNIIRLEMDSLAKYDFTAPVLANYSLKEGVGGGKIIINFAPRSAGIKTGRLIIMTSIGNDTIPIYANVLPAPKTLAIRTEAMIAPICDSISGFIYFRNGSCREMTFNSITVSSPFQILPIRVPFYIEPGDSAAIPIRYVPSGRGSETVTAKAKLSFSMPFADEDFDTTLTLTGFGAHGASSYMLSKKSIAFDTLHICDSASQNFALYSTGCDSLQIRSILISGDPDFIFSSSTLLSPTFSLASGESISFNISLIPISPGNKSATITITLTDNSKIIIPITAPIKRAVRILSYAPQGTIDLGTDYTCHSGDTSVTFTNPSCDTVEVMGIYWQGTGFGSSTLFPIFIPSGESRTITISTIIDTVGGKTTNTAVLNFVTNADNIIAPITLTRSYILPHQVHLWLDGDKSPLPASSIWKVRIKGFANELTDVQTIDYTINYNTDLLGFLPGASSAQSSDGRTFHLTSSQITSAGLDVSLGEMAFEVFLTKDTATSLTITSITLNSSDPQFMGCVATTEATGGADFVYLDSCSDRTIRTFMRGEHLQFGIHPNPARDAIEIELHSPTAQDANIEIFNALGVKVSSEGKKLIAGQNIFHIETATLPQGVYIIRIGQTSQSFVKVK